MKKYSSFKLATLASATIIFLVLSGCNSTSTDNSTPSIVTVEITDAHGTVSVPVNPKVVVALDNRTYETLADWGIEVAAAPKAIISDGIIYKTDDSVRDIGSHNEPNLEIIAAVNPDLVIVGQRFGAHYATIKELVPDAVVIDLNIDTSVNAETPGENLINGFKNSILALGQIFDKSEETTKLVADFDTSLANAKEAYNGTDTIMTVIVSGGSIRFAAPGSGRVWGPLYEIFDWTSSLELVGASSDHQGDDISLEAIAQSNPDWIFVLDRDAATYLVSGSAPAADVIANSPALQNINAVRNGQIIYAPNNTYTNETIQTFTALFNDIAAALGQ